MIFLIIIIIFIPKFIGDYNCLVKYKNKCNNNWDKINIVLKRKADLIANLVNVIKEYTNHEKNTLEDVIKARSTYISASSINDQIIASNELNNTLDRLMMLTESYPDLKANTNFLSLQKEIKETEDLIKDARNEYNNSVNDYQNKKEVFPSMIIAYLFEFKDIEFYSEREVL